MGNKKEVTEKQFPGSCAKVLHCQTISDIPLPPIGKTGWPWTEESPKLPDTMFNGSPWPKISIVTPSLNQGKFIEETIRSVLLQGYPDLEYIIIDGGSTDETVEIIRKYEKWLAYWVSESDSGQSSAINKGFDRSKGEIVAWINSDDMYLAGCFEKVAEFFSKNVQFHMVYGACCLIDEKSGFLGKPDLPIHFDLKRLIEHEDYIPQPSVFFRKRVLKEVGGVIETLQYSMDYEFWIRIGRRYPVKKIDSLLSCFRIQPQQKTFETHADQYRENLLIRARYGGIKEKCLYVRCLLAEKILMIKSISNKINRSATDDTKQ